MSDSIETIVDKVAASIPPTVRTGLFIDLFAPDGRWYHEARYAVDYGDVEGYDEREDMHVTTGTPVICTTIVKDDSIRFDARPLRGLPDDSFAYDDVVELELGGILDGEPRPTDIRQVYDDYMDEFAPGPEVTRLLACGALMEAYRLVFRLSDLNVEHMVSERARSWTPKME